jgi:hypothetical protein
MVRADMMRHAASTYNKANKVMKPPQHNRSPLISERSAQHGHHCYSPMAQAACGQGLNNING